MTPYEQVLKQAEAYAGNHLDNAPPGRPDVATRQDINPERALAKAIANSRALAQEIDARGEYVDWFILTQRELIRVQALALGVDRAKLRDPLVQLVGLALAWATLVADDVDSAGSEYEKLIAEEDRIESEMIADGRLVVGEDGVARRPPSDNAGGVADG